MQTHQENHTLCPASLHHPDRLSVFLYVYVLVALQSHNTPMLTASTGVDLHDLHDLRTRSLLFVHNLVESLRAAGVSIPTLLPNFLFCQPRDLLL